MLSVNGKTFREACCAELGIPSDAFEEALLWQCLHPCVQLLGRLPWRLNRAYFDADLELIRTVGDCASVSEVRTELGVHFYHNPVSGFRRRVLHIRLSGQRLVNFAATLIS